MPSSIVRRCRRGVVVLPLFATLATLAGCAGPDSDPIAAECAVAVSGDHGNVGLPSVAAAVAYETLAMRGPRGEFSVRRESAGEVVVRERAPDRETIRQVVRNEHGWISALERSSHPACAAFRAEFALPGEPLAVPEGRSVVDDVCGGEASAHGTASTRAGGTPVLAVADSWWRGQPDKVSVRTVGERRALVRLLSGEFRYVYDVRRHGDTWRVRSHLVGGCPEIASEFERRGQPYRGPAFRRAGR